MRLGLAVLPMVTRFSADRLKTLSPACSSGIQYNGAQKHDPVQHLMGMLACWILNDDARQDDEHTTTSEYVTPATTSKLSLKASERSLNTPPIMSTAMNKIEMPMTSLYL